jgi:K+-transporting ATPase KdpF subunit
LIPNRVICHHNVSAPGAVNVAPPGKARSHNLEHPIKDDAARAPRQGSPPHRLFVYQQGGAAMDFDFALAGIASVGLCIYLVYALIYPEKF